MGVPGAKHNPAYGLTRAAVELRICERFGIDPFGPTGPDSWDAGRRRLLMAYESIRERQEAMTGSMLF